MRAPLLTHQSRLVGNLSEANRIRNHQGLNNRIIRPEFLQPPQQGEVRQCHEIVTRNCGFSLHGRRAFGIS
jgi:hypothetical protein